MFQNFLTSARIRPGATMTTPTRCKSKTTHIDGAAIHPKTTILDYGTGAQNERMVQPALKYVEF